MIQEKDFLNFQDTEEEIEGEESADTEEEEENETEEDTE